MKNRKILLIPAFLATAVVCAFGVKHAYDSARETHLPGTLFTGNMGAVKVVPVGQDTRLINPAMMAKVVARSKADIIPEGGDVALEATASFQMNRWVENGCVVRSFTKPDAPASKVYFSRTEPLNPGIYDRQLMEFLVPAHEVTHCIYRPPRGTVEPDYNPDYLRSVMETAADLGMVLLYAQKTGTFDAWENTMRLQRHAVISAHNQDHTSTWAIDAIIQDLDPKAMQRKSVDEIFGVVRYLMHKHFEAPHTGILINPKTEPVTPVMSQMLHEMAAEKAWSNNIRPNNPVPIPKDQAEWVQKLQDDVTDSLRLNHQTFMAELTFDEQEKVVSRAKLFMASKGLEYVESQPLKTAPVSPVSGRDLPF